MTLKIYNDLTKKKEEFVPLEKNKIKMYVCGPTIYDYGHLGHGRSAIAFDMIRKYFLYKGFEVIFVFNYTDIEDKMIKRANEEGITVKQLADKFSDIYDVDYAKLNILKPTFRPKATETITEIIELIKLLEEKGFTYLIEEDGVYFDISKFNYYGKLSGQNIEDLRAGARVEVESEKKHPEDFVLWKLKKENEPFWPSPWGEGRPGWHIECSAMSRKFLGDTIDVHGGGLDLIFPHHEDEIAQSEAALGKQFSRFWMHNGFVQIDKEKMSKSLGNFKSLRNIFENYDSRLLRLFLLSTHYRAPINFSKEGLEQTKEVLQKFDDFIIGLKGIKKDFDNKEISVLIKKAKNGFEEAMDDDINISQAFATIFDLMKEAYILISEEKIGKKNASEIIDFMKKIDSVLGIMKFDDEKLDDEILKLINEREIARKNKDFKKSDEIRNKLTSMGIQLNDTKDGVTWKRIS